MCFRDSFTSLDRWWGWEILLLLLLFFGKLYCFERILFILFLNLLHLLDFLDVMLQHRFDTVLQSDR